MTTKMKKTYIIPATEIYHVQLHNVLMLSALDTPADAGIPMEVKGIPNLSGVPGIDGIPGLSGVLNSGAWDFE